MINNICNDTLKAYQQLYQKQLSPTFLKGLDVGALSIIYGVSQSIKNITGLSQPVQAKAALFSGFASAGAGFLEMVDTATPLTFSPQMYFSGSLLAGYLFTRNIKMSSKVSDCGIFDFISPPALYSYRPVLALTSHIATASILACHQPGFGLLAGASALITSVMLESYLYNAYRLDNLFKVFEKKLKNENPSPQSRPLNRPMERERELCQILGIPFNAERDEAHKIYKNNIRVFHPDMKHLLPNPEEFKRYKTIYEELCELRRKRRCEGWD